MAKKRTEKNSKEAWRLKKKAQAELKEGDVFRTDRPLTFEEAIQVAKKETAKLSPAEQVEFHKRIAAQLKEAQDHADPNDLYDGKITTPLNFKFLADEVRAQFRGQPEMRSYVGQKRETDEEQSVESYLEFLGFSLKFTREPNPDPDLRADRMRTYLGFREARVFHIGPETYGAIHDEADRHTTMLAGVPFTARTEDAPKISEANSDRYIRTLIGEAKHQAYPDQFPFSSIFLGYGRGVYLEVQSNLWRIPKALREDDSVHELCLLGHLMTAEGLAYACLKGVTDDGDALWVDEARTEAGWPRGLGLEPWILPHLIRIINDHRTFVVETEISGAIRSDIKKHKKVFGLDYKHMPIPFYSLRLQSHVIKEKVRRQLGRPAKPKSYKTDVRGHERCRIRRGQLPIAPDLATKLIERGYTIFASTKLDEETYRRLSERGLGYKRADEWMAVKATWVKEHMTSNDPQLPYVPAMRVAGKIRTPKKATGGWTDDPAAR